MTPAGLGSRAALSRGAGATRPAPADLLLLALAGWLAWRPAETFPWSAAVVASVGLALVVWAWRRSDRDVGRWWWIGLAILAVLVATGVGGSDPSAVFPEAALLAAIAGLAWLSSRRRPPEHWPAVLGLLISGLAVWGVLQVTAGPEHADAVLAQLPEHLRPAAAERLASGRAFASQPLPSHLAVLLATSLPLLLARVRLRWRTCLWAAGSLLCLVGLAVTRSPIGVGLALAACGALAVAHGGRAVRWSMLALVAVLSGVVVLRGDVLDLDPVRLRGDNWKTAGWVWSTSPVAGVGFGGFAQAAQAVPFAVGNRPRHAHSLPMEWLAELGPVGALAVLAAAIALWRLIRDLWPIRPDLAVAIAVIPAHNLVDFSFYGSGVALPWAVLLGWAAATRGPRVAATAGPRGRAVAVTVTATALALAVLHATSSVVFTAATRRATAAERFAGAIEARRLAPWRADVLPLVGIAALEADDPAMVSAAASELELGRWLRPRSAALADLRSRLAQARGRAPSALAEAWTASRAAPADPAYGSRLNQLFDVVPERDHGQSR